MMAITRHKHDSLRKRKSNRSFKLKEMGEDDAVYILRATSDAFLRTRLANKHNNFVNTLGKINL